jgi:hypothetical protein
MSIHKHLSRLEDPEFPGLIRTKRGLYPTQSVVSAVERAKRVTALKRVKAYIDAHPHAFTAHSGAAVAKMIAAERRGEDTTTWIVPSDIFKAMRMVDAREYPMPAKMMGRSGGRMHPPSVVGMETCAQCGTKLPAHHHPKTYGAAFCSKDCSDKYDARKNKMYPSKKAGRSEGRAHRTPFIARRVKSGWRLFLNVDGMRSLATKSAADSLTEKVRVAHLREGWDPNNDYEWGVWNKGGVTVIGPTDDATVYRTKEAVTHAAHVIGRYFLGFGDLVFTYLTFSK